MENGEAEIKEDKKKFSSPLFGRYIFQEYLIECRGRNRRGNVACVSRHNAAVNQPGV